MLFLRTGNSVLNANTLSVTWPSSNQINFYSWLGRIQNASTANVVNQINATIKACGFLKEPVNGVIPPNSKVIIFTSNLVNPTYNSFADLSDTVYVIFQNNVTQQAGHFINYSSSFGGALGTDNMTTIVRFGACSDQVTYFRSKLVTTSGFPGSQKGASVLFTPAGAASYYNKGCQAPFPPFSADWKNPGTICDSDPPLNLANLITGTKGGTFTGPGVSGSTFNPSGLSGTVTITYSVKSGNCTKTQPNTFTITTAKGAEWTPPDPICGAKTIQLSTLLSGGTSGGTWTGTGVSNGVFNSAGLNGQIPVTYTVGTGNCKSIVTKNIQVTSKPNPNWGPLPVSLCENGQNIDLPSLITGTIGGSFKGSGVNSGIFSPKGLNGSVELTYVVGAQTCADSSKKSITIIPVKSAEWTPPNALCPGTSITLSTLLSGGDPGGVWSGSGVSNGQFNSTDLNGSIPITYTVGTGNCASTVTKNIQVITKANPTWNALPTSICESGQDINLTPLITGTPGGTFKGKGVANNIFSPKGLSGQVEITYSVGSTGCSDSSKKSLVVIPTPPPPIVSGKLEYCEGTTPESLNATGVPNARFKWFTNEQLNNLVAGSPSYTPETTSGSYWVIQELGTCASAPTKVTLTTNPKPAPPLVDKELVYCTGLPVPPAKASGGQGQFLWYSDAALTNNVFKGSPYQPGITQISIVWVLEDLNGCKGDPSKITYRSLPGTIAVIDPKGPIILCGNENAVLKTPTTGNILWSTGEKTSSITVTQPGMVKLTATGDCNTSADSVLIIKEKVSADFQVSVNTGSAPLEVNITPDPNDPGTVCDWRINETNAPEAQTGLLIFELSGSYFVKRTCKTPAGCKDEYVQKIQVSGLPVEVFIPNTFRPDGNDRNDRFKAEGLGIKKFTGLIYDRWGNLIFSWSNFENGWDGTINGQMAPDGVYVYRMDFVDRFDKSFSRIGRVTLLY